MPLLVLYGPPASGKLTIGLALAALTRYRLFHNHLTVDLLLSVFDFGSEPFVRLREEIWLSVIPAAAACNAGVIFTFAPEQTVAPAFLARLAGRVRAAGHAVRFVELTCSERDLEQRLTAGSRRGTGKLQSVEDYRMLRNAGVLQLAGLPAPDLVVNTSLCAPDAAAARIAGHLARG